ncbi:MAG: nucleoside hydrolase [Ktedonobacteraceae bacterium]|nr:nucleoside hydrolase [Ktedonobacteraceae bacterium]
MNETPVVPLPVFIDTDIGDDIDDALALALLLCTLEVSVVGISTVFGDTHLRARLAMYLLQIYGHASIPVAAGQAMPLLFRHRPSGVCQASVLPTDFEPSMHPLTGPELLIQTAHKYPGQLTLLCLGPLTNVALALQMEPGLGALLRQVFFMGGTSQLWWPDWNVRSDAEAAYRLVEARLPVTMIGLNVTASCHLQRRDIEHLHAAKNSRLQLLSDLIVAWQEKQPWWRSQLPYLHDPLVVAALCAPQLFRFTTLPIHIFARGVLSGWTIPRWLPGPTVRAALSVENDQARAWILHRLFAAM